MTKTEPLWDKRYLYCANSAWDSSQRKHRVYFHFCFTLTLKNYHKLLILLASPTGFEPVLSP